MLRVCFVVFVAVVGIRPAVFADPPAPNDSPPGSRYLVVIDGANHLSFGGGLGARGSDFTDVVKLTSTLFWDAFLKDSEPARASWQSDEPPKDAGDRWP